MSLIILLGPKHSGKTSIGRELARRFKMPFYDLDQLIEEKTGKNIRELYKAGEELFRREETAGMAALLQKKTFEEPGGREVVLALGGGIIDNPHAMALLQRELQKSTGHCTVYLEVSSETAWNRIAVQGELPPFLEAETPPVSKEKHCLLHERRAGDYKKIATYCLFAEGKSAAELAEDLYNLILYNNTQKEKSNE